MNKCPTVFLFIFLLFPFHAFSYDAKTTHPYLTEITVDFHNQSAQPNKITEQEKQWLMQGSIGEDSGLRSINHFYDPVFNKTWELKGIEYLFPALTAKNWAQNQFAQAAYDSVYFASVGLITKSPVFSKTNHTWQKAIYEYIKGNKESAFQSLGHILHLIQDMSVPEHTRANVHIFLSNQSISHYEDYAARIKKIDYLKILEALKGVATFQNYDQNIGVHFDKIAIYSNNNFYSPDTIVGSPYEFPQPIFPKVPEIGVDGILRFYVLGQDEEKKFFYLAKKEMEWRYQSGFSSYTLKDDKVLQDYWERLSKRAVLTGAGVIDLFFKEVEKAKNDPNFIAKNEKNILLAMVTGIQDFIKRVFQKEPDFIIVENINENKPLVATTLPPVISKSVPETTVPRKISEQNVTSPATIKQITETTVVLKNTTTTTKEKTTTTTTTTLRLAPCKFSSNQSPKRDKVIINEVAWMGSLKSPNGEWIELKNIANSEIDISGWHLIDRDEQIKVVFPSKTKIKPNQFLILERSNDETLPFISADFIYVGALANSNEGLRLFDGYCNLIDEVFANPDWPAGDNLEKRTMERAKNFSWHTYNGQGQNGIFGTPKKENSEPAIFSASSQNQSGTTTTTVNLPTTTTTTMGDTATTTTLPPTTTTTTMGDTTTTTTLPPTTTTTTSPDNYSKIIISEIKIAGLDKDGKTLVYDEFVELYNPNNFTIDLSDWYLQRKTATSANFSSFVPANLLSGKTIHPYGFFLITHSNNSVLETADIFTNYSLTDNNTIVLKNSQREIVDKVGFGEANDCEGNCALNPPAGRSIQRKFINGEFIDTDNNAEDFELQDCPSPKTRNGSCQSAGNSSLNTIYLENFSWYSAIDNPTLIVVEFDIRQYPFIPETENTNNIFTAVAFYLNQDVPGSEYAPPFGYLGWVNFWELDGSIPGLVLNYLNCQGYFRNTASIVFTDSTIWCTAPGEPRGLAYNLYQFPQNNHFVVRVVGATNNRTEFTGEDYLTIGFYGYDKISPSYLRLVAFDNTRYYFNSNNL